ncbi:MAG: hypothetical protein JEZ00_10440 [Anaerolineaceae bacterium]|nr:hypothetical protein [Anaerolineaceae bacterium]
MKKLLLFTIGFGLFAAMCLLLSNVDQWLIYTAALLSIVGFFVILNKRSTFSVPAIGLSFYFILVIISFLNGSAIHWLISGTVAAIATSDLIHFQENLQSKTTNESTKRMINQHIFVLLITLIFGWLISFLALYMEFKLPFLVILFLCITGVYSFFLLFKSMKL